MVCETDLDSHGVDYGVNGEGDSLANLGIAGSMVRP